MAMDGHESESREPPGLGSFAVLAPARSAVRRLWHWAPLHEAAWLPKAQASKSIVTGSSSGPGGWRHRESCPCSRAARGDRSRRPEHVPPFSPVLGLGKL